MSAMSTDSQSADKWLAARRQVQQLAEVVLGESAAFFLYRGKLYGPQLNGQHVSALLGSADGCEFLLELIEQLDANEPVDAVIVDGQGQEPAGPGRPVLKLLVGHLVQMWPNGRWEPV